MGTTLVLTLCLLLTGCSGVQSALTPAGRSAERIADLFWWMTAGATVVWCAVVALIWYAIRQPPGERQHSAFLIIGGGTVAPVIVLGVLLGYGLNMMPAVLNPVEGALRIKVSGVQWWWRFTYLLPDGGVVETANEIRLPSGSPVEFVLESPDVIHSFWIPSLAGKMDMIPGRTTRLAVEPFRTGVFRAACAEFCGASHALMNFYAIVVPQEEFTVWLNQQAQTAQNPREGLASRGAELFLRNGCAACHTIRGTAANGTVGPDLTHAGGRMSIGAGVLGNSRADFANWLVNLTRLKPEVRMPSFHMLPPADVDALAAYLDGLQ